MIPQGDDNPFRDNPYASPDLQSNGTPGGSPYPPARRSLVGHVPAVAILMIVQGALEVFMGFVLIGIGAVLPRFMQSDLAQQGRPPEGPSPEAMTWIMLTVYGVFGLIVLGGAFLHILAGILNYKFRSRVLGIVASIAGMVTTFFTCYCAPTAIALGVYGLVCYTNPDVIQAFALTAAERTQPNR